MVRLLLGFVLFAGCWASATDCEDDWRNLGRGGGHRGPSRPHARFKDTGPGHSPRQLQWVAQEKPGFDEGRYRAFLEEGPNTMQTRLEGDAAYYREALAKGMQPRLVELHEPEFGIEAYGYAIFSKEPNGDVFLARAMTFSDAVDSHLIPNAAEVAKGFVKSGQAKRILITLPNEETQTGDRLRSLGFKAVAAGRTSSVTFGFPR